MEDSIGPLLTEWEGKVFDTTAHMSRINHRCDFRSAEIFLLNPVSTSSCSANVYKVPIAASLSSQLRVARSIKKDELLFSIVALNSKPYNVNWSLLPMALNVCALPVPVRLLIVFGDR
jgi:hypothetical protein